MALHGSSSTSSALVFPNRVTTTTVTTGSTTTVIPVDGTIPQITEGAEALTLSITPRSAIARIRVEAIIKGQTSVTSFITAALFLNGGANAVEAGGVYQATASGSFGIYLAYEYVPGSTSAQTIAARYGPNSGSTATITINQEGGQTLGGIMLSSMTAYEIA